MRHMHGQAHRGGRERPRIPGRAGAQVAAALPDLRLGRRRQVDADRPAALRHQADLRRPAGDAGARFQEARHDRRRHRLRAAGRRAGGRARAGHHHRRRLSLLRDAEAQVHRRRHAGPRAVHAQHGDRRLDGRSRHHAGRRAPGRAGADAAPFHHRLAARHPPHRRWRSTRSTWSTSTRRCSTGSSPTMPDFAKDLGFASIAPIPMSARYGDNVTRRSRADAAGTRGRRCSSISRRSAVDDDRRWTGRSAFRCSM